MLKTYFNSQKKAKRQRNEDINSVLKTKNIPQLQGILPQIQEKNVSPKGSVSLSKKVYGNERTYREVTSHNNAQSKYLKDQMAMIEKVKKSKFMSRLFDIH